MDLVRRVHVSRYGHFALMVLALAGVGVASEALAQTTPDVIEQTLDRADVFSRYQGAGRKPNAADLCGDGNHRLYRVPEHFDARHVLPRQQRCPQLARSRKKHQKLRRHYSACSDPGFCARPRRDLHGDDGRPVGQRLARRQEEQRVQPVQGGQGALHGRVYGIDNVPSLLCSCVRVRPPAARRHLAGGR